MVAHLSYVGATNYRNTLVDTCTEALANGRSNVVLYDLK